MGAQGPWSPRLFCAWLSEVCDGRIKDADSSSRVHQGPILYCKPHPWLSSDVMWPEQGLCFRCSFLYSAVGLGPLELGLPEVLAAAVATEDHADSSEAEWM